MATQSRQTPDGWLIYDDATSFSRQTPGGWVIHEVVGGGSTYFRSLSGTITLTGQPFKLTSKHPTGSLTMSGGLTTKSVLTILLTGSMTLSGAVRKLTHKAMAGGITASGSIRRKTSRVLQGTITSTGQLARKVLKRLSGSLTASGALSTQAVIGKLTTGLLTLAGAVSAFKFTPIVAAITSSLTHLRRFCGRR